MPFGSGSLKPSHLLEPLCVTGSAILGPISLRAVLLGYEAPGLV